jgi:GNAT superfamily N-acetyltransferase
MAVTVRLARLGDEGSIAGYLVKLVEQHVEYDPKRFSKFVTLEGAAAFYASRFDAAEARVLVAESDDRVIGFAYLEFEARNYAQLAEDVVWLHDIFVGDGFRSEGAGKALVEAAGLSAREMGANKLVLATAARNVSAQGFFERFGFRPTMIEMTLDV